jgi:hypothetical protein
MIVPQFWAESRIQERFPDKQITVRRFGWSDVSLDEAQAHADSRAKEAFDRVVAGETLRRREPRVPYNGAEGVPIREEIVSRHGDTIITRNSYGALCLNTPDVAFADVDEAAAWPVRGCCAVSIIMVAAAGVVWWQTGRWQTGVLLIALALLSGPFVTAALHKMLIALRGGLPVMARRRIDRFVNAHPEWRLRLYRTPSGFRILVLHRTFDPRSVEIAEFFAATATDPRYAAMCRAQNCFRARVSPKPWRIGIVHALRPRRAAWPVKPEYLPEREAWIREYTAAAESFASCHFIAEFGQGDVDESVREVQVLHDELCRAESDLPVA